MLGRESSAASAAMEEWMELARMVRATLELVDALELEALGSIARAKSSLYVRRYTMGVIASGVVVPGPVINDPVNPTDILDDALREIARHNELHSMAVRVFSLYGERLGLLRPAPLWQGFHLLQHNSRWQAWVRHTANALDHAGEVLKRLRSAASYDLATRDAVAVAQGLPAESPYWNAWMLAAERLAVRAHEEAAMARIEAYKMRDAALMEYFDALKILDH